MKANINMSECEDRLHLFHTTENYNNLIMSNRKGKGKGKGKGKQVIDAGERHEWDADDWEWDSNLFTAKHLNVNIEQPQQQPPPQPPGLGVSSFCWGDTKISAEKRRKVVMGEEEEEMAACLTLKLGGGYTQSETETTGAADKDDDNGGCRSGKRPRTVALSCHHPICQVDDCKADLNNAKDYHRRHKVCEMHAKATKALVGRLMQRFCQQCSRFHLLQEFDEGKRSCRRRLAGHNRRRRKSHPDAIVAGAYLNDEHASGSLIISLLRVLSQLQTSNNSDHTSNQDLMLQLLKKLVSSASILNETNAAAAKHSIANQRDDLLTCNTTSEGRKPHESVRHQDVQCSMLNSSIVASSSILGVVDPHPDVVQSGNVSSIWNCAQPCVSTHMPHNPQGSACTTAKLVVPHYSKNSQVIREGLQQHFDLTGQSVRLQPTEQRRGGVSNGFDLNSVDNAVEELFPASDGPSTLMLLGGLDSRSRQSAPFRHSWSVSDIHRTSPTQISDNSESGSDQSPSSSQGDGQDRTGRIVFKLFGKDPSEIPHLLRSQILDWLAHSPSDIESYIRPGCVILTIYLCLSESVWEELGTGLKISLERLVKGSDSSFWQTGWIFVQVGHRIAFICDGQVVFDTPSDFGNSPKILSIIPIAVTAGTKANIVVKGRNLSSSTSKILCAFQGKHLVQESSTEYIQEDTDLQLHGTDHFEECTRIQCQNFSWVPQNMSGRCFIEVEGYDLRCSFFPVIVAEKNICSEIRTLERYIDIPSKASQFEATQNCGLQVKEKTEAIEFLHELGWLFQRSCLNEPNLRVLPVTAFSSIRFKWLLEYATEQDWCAVVNKILNILFSSYEKNADSLAINIVAEVGILHRAVRRNCRAMVEFLLAYVPDSVTENTVAIPTQEHEILSRSDNFVFKPDMPGPAGLTPLHIAASMESADGVVDALTNDPCQIGAKAWTNVCDQSGKTAEAYALLGGRYSYIELVHKKLEKKGIPEHVSINIPKLFSDEQNSLKPVSGSRTALQEVSGEKSKVQGNKADIQLSQKIGHSVSLCSDHGKVRRLPSYCNLCEQQQLNKLRTSNLIYRPAMLSMVAIATVCVCVTLLLKGPPQVLFVMPPFRWESIDFGPK